MFQYFVYYLCTDTTTQNSTFNCLPARNKDARGLKIYNRVNYTTVTLGKMSFISQTRKEIAINNQKNQTFTYKQLASHSFGGTISPLVKLGKNVSI